MGKHAVGDIWKSTNAFKQALLGGNCCESM